MPTRDLLTKAAFVCLFVLCGAGTADAQELPGRRSLLTDMGQDNPLQQLRQRLSGSGAAVPLEGALDPERYIVGPGDLFDVSIGGAQPILVTLPVSADGYLMLPEAGSIPVTDLPLAVAKARVQSALKIKFQHVGVEVSLAQPRQFYVHVAGAVPVPGRYLATPVARVASVLEVAFADSTRPAVTNPAYRPSLRNITLLRRDGGAVSVDLARYFATGDTDHNPYLGDGDVLNVPAYDPQREAVFVDGAVAFPGTYDYRPDDRLRDVLTLATGEAQPRATGGIRITRRRPDGSLTTQAVDAATLASDEGFMLEPRDHVYVVPTTDEGGQATIEGWVQYPGTYPIIPGETTLRQLVDRAGGLRQEALARGATLERLLLPKPRLPRAANRFEPTLPRPSAAFADTVAILHNMRLADFDYMSRAYLAQELRVQNRVPLDLGALLADGAEPVHVQNHDYVYVPRDEGSVFVFGQVNRPGHIPYAPGRSVQEYVQAAGGASPLATSAPFVIEAGTGRYIPASQAEIRSGDMIFLDRRDDIADTAELQRLVFEERRARADARFRTMQTVLQLASTTATILTTYLLIKQQK